MELRLRRGCPPDADKRLNKEKKVYELLDRLGISYEYVDHAPAMTMEDCEEIDRVLRATMCKNLFLCNRQKTRFYLLMIAHDKKFLTKELSAQIGSARLSFGSAEDMEALIDITPGSVSVLGLMYDKEEKVQLLIDEDLLCADYFGAHPCVNTTSLRLSMKAVLQTFLPAVAHEPVTVRLGG